MRHPRPRRLYKYQPPFPVAISNLEKQQLWLTPPGKFNDPYDCALHVFRGELSDSQFEQFWEWLRTNDPLAPTAEASLRENGALTAEARHVILAAMSDAFESQRAQLFATVGIACLSERHDDLLMWGHYADGHRGFCLGFATDRPPFDHADKVEYVTSVPVVDPLSVLPGAAPSTYIRTTLLTKAACWKYEAEWRILSRHGNAPASYADGGLEVIYLGAATVPADRDRMDAIGRRLGVPVRRMVTPRDRFGLVEDS